MERIWQYVYSKDQLQTFSEEVRCLITWWHQSPSLLCITPGVFELWEELGTPPLFFLNLAVVKLSSFPSQKIQEMSKMNSSPYLMFWPDWKSDFQCLLLTHSLIYSALCQVLLTFPVLPVHQAYPLSSDIIWSEEGENHSHVVWKELTKNYYMTESERLCKWRRNISAYTCHDRVPLPFLRGCVF